MRKRIVFDIALTVILLFEMLYQVTGNTAHEVVGALFFVCIVVHLAFNRKWIGGAASSISSRQITKRNRLLCVIASLLAVDVVLLVVSSLVISESLWNAGVNLTALNPGNVWYPIHVGASYALCILVLFHLSVHWITVADVLKIGYDPARREAIGSGINAVLTIGAIALGIGGIMRTSFESSDFAVTAEGEGDGDDGKTVVSGYRERNAETGEVTEANVEVHAITNSNDGPDGGSKDASDSAEAKRCPICPRQCKLSAPRCNRPYEQGLI